MCCHDDLKIANKNRKNRENCELTRISVISAKINLIIILIIEITITCYLNYPIKFGCNHDFDMKK